MSVTLLLGAGLLAVRLRRPAQNLRAKYDAALQALQRSPQDPQCKQEALRRGRAYYVQRAGKTISRERQYSIEAALTREVERTIAAAPKPRL
ncbi:hypothetical protein [Anthocerotibacter panamensis]|uniref:hypothetical protein n=1 Tax=Anthocerotibacter panamensis TaxID=2857077 RepID=UPI001C402E70|nr:hypothetical protein [Anthocerotibacter panamensis]